MRSVYVMTDLEGVAGVVSFVQQTYADGIYFEDAKKLLTAEVSAAVEGLLEAGVEDILVCDGHGPGGIRFEELHPRARLQRGWLPSRDIQDAILAEYDGCAMIGQHAMAGTPTGNLNHTQNSRSVDYYKLNGKPIGEIAQFALYEGALGVPMIFLSGDEAACREAEELIPGIKTTPVKRGLGREAAISLSAHESRRRIQSGIREAVERHRAAPIEPLVWPGPFVLEKRYFTSAQADMAAGAPGAERVDGQTVRFRADDVQEIING